jgi:hypothetical protein
VSELAWTPDTARLDSLELWDANPKRMSKARAARLLRSWEEMGQYQTLAIGPAGEVYDGHQRIKTLVAAGYRGDYELRVLRASRALTDAERRRVVTESTIGTVGSWDWDALSGWDAGELSGWGFDADLLREWNDDAANLALMLDAESPIPVLDSVGGLDGGNYGDVASSSNVPINILGIGGLVERELIEWVRDRLLSEGASEDGENGVYLSAIFRAYLDS